MIKVGIVGGTGYTGAELLRLLAGHPQAQVTVITSRQAAGRQASELYPNLRGHCDLAYTNPEAADLESCDVVFFATPHGTAMHQVPQLLEAGVRIVDLSADFRLRDQATWEAWYKEKHAAPQWLSKAVYGLPELDRSGLAEARLVAVAGCYPTGIQLGFLPLLEAGVVHTQGLIADAKSGVSGAGRSAKVGSLFTECADSFKAYGASGHRHLPEIEQGLRRMTEQPLSLVFVPHLVPMIRGIHSTLYAQLTLEVDVQALFEARYKDEPFVDVMPPGSHPETRSVRGTNMCRLAIHRQPGSNTVIVLAVEDNLVKGASGQAVQCFNAMFGLSETLGLQQPAVLP